MTRLFFTCDMHGSERCFRKFLAAATVHKADIIMINGDLTGKAIVPIIEQPDGTYKAEFLGGEEKIKSEKQLQEFVERIAATGYYHLVVTPDVLTELQDNKEKLEKIFNELMLKRLAHWVELAEERLSKIGVRCFMMPGNDDILECDRVIRESDIIINPDGKVINLDEDHEMASLGWSNPTPWDTPRECSEKELGEKIEALIQQVKNLKNCVFNFHVPPYNCGLDIAPKLDEELRPVIGIGGPVKVPVGSTSVRKVVEEYQPLLGLFGHIHESGGETYIGRTLCLNPGSEYHEGLVRAYVIDLEKGKIVKHFRVEG